MNLYGGALQVLYLIRGLANRDMVQNTLVCPGGSAILDAARGYADRTYGVSIRGDLDLSFIVRLAMIIRKTRPDIVHLHSRRGADILGGLSARITGTPCILTRRVDNPESRLWSRLKYGLYDKVITISQGIMNVLLDEGVPPDRISCVPSGVDTDDYSEPCDRQWYMKEFGIMPNERTCGVVAQLIERKGHRYLLEAMPEILAAHPGTRFLLFGKGPLEAKIRDMSDRAGFGDKVIFAGFREDLNRILGCLDLLIHPALMEGLGVSLLQGAAAGVPIVATVAGGIPEVVVDGVNGLLVPAGDSGLLAAAVNRVLSDKDLALKLGQEGRKIAVRKFSIASMVDGNLEVYRQIIQRRS
jgi:glycosyltransferase involved in cell wall biosynthesis